MPRETIRTSDAELYVGWPTTPDDLERDRSVQVGVRYGDHSAWAVLTSPDEVDELRRTLQRAKRAIWPTSVPVIPPPNRLDAAYVGDHLDSFNPPPPIGVAASVTEQPIRNFEG